MCVCVGLGVPLQLIICLVQYDTVLETEWGKKMIASVCKIQNVNYAIQRTDIPNKLRTEE